MSVKEKKENMNGAQDRKAPAFMIAIAAVAAASVIFVPYDRFIPLLDQAFGARQITGVVFMALLLLSYAALIVAYSFLYKGSVTHVPDERREKLVSAGITVSGAGFAGLIASAIALKIVTGW